MSDPLKNPPYCLTNNYFLSLYIRIDGIEKGVRLCLLNSSRTVLRLPEPSPVPRVQQEPPLARGHLDSQITPPLDRTTKIPIFYTTKVLAKIKLLKKAENCNQTEFVTKLSKISCFFLKFIFYMVHL